MALHDRLLTLFCAQFDALPSLVTRAPGRVNLIGEHTDYNDGFVLPMAISRQTMVAIRPRGDAVIRLVAGDLDGARADFRLDAPITPDPAHGWSNYVRGVAALLQEQGLDLIGADIAILGDMPQGAGLSSSAALENAVGLALAAVAGRPDIDRTQLARIGQLAEHRFAGCQCGIMDQLVSARAAAGPAQPRAAASTADSAAATAPVSGSPAARAAGGCTAECETGDAAGACWPTGVGTSIGRSSAAHTAAAVTTLPRPRLRPVETRNGRA